MLIRIAGPWNPSKGVLLSMPILLNRFSKSRLAIRLFRALASAGVLLCPLRCVRGRGNGRLHSLKGVLEGIREKFVGADRGAQTLPEGIANHSVRGDGLAVRALQPRARKRVCAGSRGGVPGHSRRARRVFVFVYTQSDN